MDSSPVGVAIAADAARAAGLPVTWVVEDATTWAPAGPVDLVVVAYVHLTSLVARAATWLAPGGRLVVVGHAVANADRGVGGPRDRRLLHDPATMRADARAAGLVVRRCGEVERGVDLREGGAGRGVQVDAVLVADRRPTAADRAVRSLRLSRPGEPGGQRGSAGRPACRRG